MNIAEGRSWRQALANHYRVGEACVLITVISTRGSSPRDAGSKMVVAEDRVYDSIGGGQLENIAVEKARQVINGPALVLKESFTLGPDLNQCCGGAVELLFEVQPASRFNIQLYGSGHVARALVRILGELDCRVRWMDERDDAFPDHLPENVIDVSSRALAAEVGDAPQNAWHLIMTHSHSLDLELCEAILSLEKFNYCGLIGSKSKGVRFRNRLREKGFTDKEIQRLHCPIGTTGLIDKRPMTIAVSVVADLMQRQALLQADNSKLKVIGS